MKKLLIAAVLLLMCNGCKKDVCSSGCYDHPASFYFTIADSKGQYLLNSTTNQLTASYLNNGALIIISDEYHPFVTMGGSTDYLILDGAMAQKSIEGIKTFYLTFQGKTDTLGLDIYRVRATPENGGNSTPIATFNGRPMQSVSGGTSTPDYFVLKRR